METLSELLALCEGNPLLIISQCLSRPCPGHRYHYPIYTGHGDVMARKHCLYYWPFVRGIHQSLVDSPHKEPVLQSFDVSFFVSWTSCQTNSWVAGDSKYHYGLMSSLLCYQLHPSEGNPRPDSATPHDVGHHPLPTYRNHKMRKQRRQAQHRAISILWCFHYPWWAPDMC